MKNGIQLAFENCKKENRTALLTYTVASDPNKKKSVQILNAIAKYTDIVELGFPHSTPVGDGGQIQTSSNRSIKNGFKMRDAFQIVKDFKKLNKTKPIILMGYYNPIHKSGSENFVKKIKDLGVDGLIIVDLPPEEDSELCIFCLNHDLHFIRLLTPTSDNHLSLIHI